MLIKIRARIRLLRQRLTFRFLDLFEEVRRLRRFYSTGEVTLRECHRDLAQTDLAVKAARSELEETKRALSVMTEARMNTERSIELLRGELIAIKETHEAEILRMQNVLDWFGLESRNRQIFGTAPLRTPGPTVEEDTSVPPARRQARSVVNEMTAEFFREAIKRGQEPPPNGPEYSSTSSAQQKTV